jgi:carbon storage regulator
MLVLTRKVNQELIIGDNIRIRVMFIGNDTVKIGIDAPDDVYIKRAESLTNYVLADETSHNGSKKTLGSL